MKKAVQIFTFRNPGQLVPVISRALRTPASTSEKVPIFILLGLFLLVVCHVVWKTLYPFHNCNVQVIESAPQSTVWCWALWWRFFLYLINNRISGQLVRTSTNFRIVKLTIGQTLPWLQDLECLTYVEFKHMISWKTNTYLFSHSCMANILR